MLCERLTVNLVDAKEPTLYIYTILFIYIHRNLNEFVLNLIGDPP